MKKAWNETYRCELFPCNGWCLTAVYFASTYIDVIMYQAFASVWEYTVHRVIFAPMLFLLFLTCKRFYPILKSLKQSYG